ncbi:hybrid sensor histidine kinase/response regulator transcription factor [Pedobacter rhizosphaerae]|uniref:histidine kinase n=1 Tax=Pedobacter rhizosphaerae TaxID=390241 RepID=A0A1H9SDV7_9SPHI|nr:hybrid sensor histidine kinase/response regulator transcription factor [Pedobacter rhizosphaerae]SER82369.1 Signal transduction histidine kinase [Pedobacter rhizosphaerae]
MRCDKLTKLFLCLLISLALSPARAQLSFTNLTVENGLSQNSVVAIAQDSTGLMWFGTRQGLNRYDGYRFKIYKSDLKKPQYILGNEITALVTAADGKLWVGTTAGLSLYDEKTDQFLSVPHLSSTNVEVIYQDHTKDIWVGTLNGLNLLTDKTNNQFQLFRFSQKANDPVNSIYAILKDKRSNVWVGTGNGLFVINRKNGAYQYKKVNLPATMPSSYITALNEDRHGHIWIGTANGLCKYDPITTNLKIFQHDNKNPGSLIHNDIRELMNDGKGQLWIGTQDGLSVLNLDWETFSNYQHDPEIGNTISHNSIHHIFKDRNRNIWIGTYFGGVNMVYPVATKFKVYRNSRFVPSISGNVLSSIIEDAQHNLWIGTEGGGLNYYNRKNNSFKAYKTNSNDSSTISSNLIKIMVKEGLNSDKLIIGTHRGGLNIFDPATGKFQRIKNVKDSTGAVGSAEILALEVDRRGTIWIGSLNGLSILQKKNGYYPNHTTKSILNRYILKKNIQKIFEDSRGDLWIATSAGLYRYNPNNKRLTQFRKNEANKTKLQSDYINCIVENRSGELLIGTYFGGLSIYNPKTNRFKTYQEGDGLINNNVLGIVEDKSQNLWISTANGLSELNPASGRFRNYTKSDGLAGNEFNARSYFIDSRGEIFLGGINGLTAFYPKDIELNPYHSPLVFTDLKLFNQTVEVNGDDDLLTSTVNHAQKLVFQHDQNHFTIEFALLNFVKPDKNKYAYLLSGYDRDWNYSSTPSATYTNIPAGKYKFLVKGINNDGIPGKTIAAAEIRIRPALWASWWAYTLYILLFSGILFLFVRYLFVKALLRRNEDVQQMKLRFFTNVSHEIRTPLTLILGPLENLLKSSKNLPEINQQVIPIKQNADRLMRLVTELMDFRKLETGNLKLHPVKQDMVYFLQEIFQSFSQLAESRNITYSFKFETQPVEIWFDKIQMEKVFFNLLSNAFKFTKNEGTITILLREEMSEIHIEVRDNGIGIPENEKDKLFSEFFQVNSPGIVHIGSGIGLALSKSIVVAHGGELLMKSRPESEQEAGDTSFTVSLKRGEHELVKVDPNDPIADENELYATTLATPSHEYQTTPRSNPIAKETVLLVEDNQEIRQLLRNTLSIHYQVLESENGQIGWEVATAQLPDLIICDVMMPIMNGLDLCKQLKTDERTAHIPVILLTARATHPQQVDGLETGADSYITKPFSLELLLLNVKNLLQSRAIMRKKFSEQVNLQPQDITINTVDHKFMIKTVQCIEERITDQDFGVLELAKDVGMSQPVLYKKIRAITDLSVNDFIKSIRLKKAAMLLEGRIHNVSEVAYLVGFNDPKYFSREFKKQYGYTPKVYLANKEGKGE